MLETGAGQAYIAIESGQTRAYPRVASARTRDLLDVKLLTPAFVALGLLFSSPVIAQQATSVAPVATATAPDAQQKVAAPAELKPSADVGQPIDRGYALQPQVTKNGQFALWMHNVILMPIITLISVFVLGLLGWVDHHGEL